MAASSRRMSASAPAAVDALHVCSNTKCAASRAPDTPKVCSACKCKTQPESHVASELTFSERSRSAQYYCDTKCQRADWPLHKILVTRLSRHCKTALADMFVSARYWPRK